MYVAAGCCSYGICAKFGVLAPPSFPAFAPKEEAGVIKACSTSFEIFAEQKAGLSLFIKFGVVIPHQEVARQRGRAFRALHLLRRRRSRTGVHTSRYFDRGRQYLLAARSFTLLPGHADAPRTYFHGRG